MRVLKLALVAFAMTASPLLAVEPFPIDGSGCPATSNLVCGLDGCVCKCPDGADAILTPPGPACRIANATPLPSAQPSPPQARGVITPPRSVPGARPPRIRTPVLKPKPLPHTGDPAATPTATPH